MLRVVSAHPILPITHFVLLKLNPSPTHYTTGFQWGQFPAMVKAVASAVSYDLMAPGLALTVLALWKSK